MPRWPGLRQVHADVGGRPGQGRAGHGHRRAAVRQQLRQCHGSDAHGSKGFPNLTDNDWLGGSGPEYIEKTVTGVAWA